jgi:hypothetical protein
MTCSWKGSKAMNRTCVEEAVATLFGVLPDDSHERFEQLCYDEGLLWRCLQCANNVALDEDRCQVCNKVAWKIGGKDRREGYGEADAGDD